MKVIDLFPNLEEYTEPYAEAYRTELPIDYSKSIDIKLKEQLKQLDSHLELLFLKNTKSWHLYRIKFYGAVKCDDLLVWQRSLDNREPGDWLIQDLWRIDKKNQEMGILCSGKESMRRFKFYTNTLYVAQQMHLIKQRLDWHKWFMHDFDHYVIRGKKHIDVGRKQHKLILPVHYYGRTG